LCIKEYESLRDRTFTARFKAEVPQWARRMVNAIALLFLIQFVLFLFLSHLASPSIVNGQFVLNNHGRITQVLTRAQYLRLKGHELRIFAAGWLSFYSYSAAYWWFMRRKTT
jgi:hypothetical protein